MKDVKQGDQVVVVYPGADSSWAGTYVKGNLSIEVAYAVLSS